MHPASAQYASLSHVLAPASTPAHPVSLAQYAVSSWSQGGLFLGIALIIVAILVLKSLSVLFRSRKSTPSS